MGLAAQDCDKRAGSRSCSAWYVARRLGHADKSAPWILKQIAALIAHEGFPPPIILYHIPKDDPEAPASKVAALTLKSRWQLEPVDAWFDGQASARLPEPIAAAAADRKGSRADDEALAGLAERTAAMAP